MADYKKNWAEFAEAFSIFAKYGDEPFSVHAEHEQIWAGPSPEVVSNEDRVRLKELGWMEVMDDGCFSVFT